MAEPDIEKAIAEFQRWHTNSCYPSASDEEAEMAVRAILTAAGVTARAPSARQVEIAANQEAGGPEGALYRLLARCDFEELRGWQTGEQIRGTRVPDRMRAVEAVLAHAAVIAALGTKSPERALRELLGQAVERAAVLLNQAMAAKTRPTLKLVTKGKDGQDAKC